MKKDFVNDEQRLYWELFSKGPKGLQGNPLLIIEFMEIEKERTRIKTEEMSR